MAVYVECKSMGTCFFRKIDYKMNQLFSQSLTLVIGRQVYFVQMRCIIFF